jgi:hypothetical protein
LVPDIKLNIFHAADRHSTHPISKAPKPSGFSEFGAGIPAPVFAA